jgi:hypothetical protein
LTRRANQRDIRIVEDYTARVASRQRALSLLRREPANSVSICRNLFAAFSSNLTRRANQLHSDIIAASSIEPAPATAAGFFISAESDGGAHASTPQSLRFCVGARALPSEPHGSQQYCGCAVIPA